MFIAVGGFFVLLNAEFLAVVQVLIYAGAIAVLIIFAVMLTRDVQRGNPPNRLQIPAGIFAGLLLAAMVVVVVDTQWEFLPESERPGVELVQSSAVANISGEALEQAGVSGEAQQEDAQSAGLADLLIGKYVLPFEAVSVLLLAALIGALALVRPRVGPGTPNPTPAVPPSRGGVQGGPGAD